mmetsp:Transcript_70891/g.191613  ORF Transcript_70891/g.191613 Transcript_70891/m.191613 type:complete len:240 (+) Transcript_70891:247-966(+)
MSLTPTNASITALYRQPGFVAQDSRTPSISSNRPSLPSRFRITTRVAVSISRPFAPASWNQVSTSPLAAAPRTSAAYPVAVICVLVLRLNCTAASSPALWPWRVHSTRTTSRDHELNALWAWSSSSSNGTEHCEIARTESCWSAPVIAKVTRSPAPRRTSGIAARWRTASFKSGAASAACSMGFTFGAARLAASASLPVLGAASTCLRCLPLRAWGCVGCFLKRNTWATTAAMKTTISI